MGGSSSQGIPLGTGSGVPVLRGAAELEAWAQALEELLWGPGQLPWWWPVRYESVKVANGTGAPVYEPHCLGSCPGVGTQQHQPTDSRHSSGLGQGVRCKGSAALGTAGRRQTRDPGGRESTAAAPMPQTVRCCGVTMTESRMQQLRPLGSNSSRPGRMGPAVQDSRVDPLAGLSSGEDREPASHSHRGHLQRGFADECTIVRMYVTIINEIFILE